MENNIFIVVAIFFLVGIQNGFSVRINKFYVPRGASHEAPIECRYDLEDDQLYDVKWYKDGSQFFRCLPNGTGNEFQVEGVKVIKYYNNIHLGSCSLTLMMLNDKSAGEYKCEVNTEGPIFKMAVDFGKMRIISMEKRIQNENINEELTDNTLGDNGASKISYTLIVHIIFIQYFIYLILL